MVIIVNNFNHFNHNYYCELIIIKDHNTKGPSEEETFRLKPER